MRPFSTTDVRRSRLPRLALVPMLLLPLGCATPGPDRPAGAPEPAAGVAAPADAPLEVTLHWGDEAQTLRGFGASDAWTLQHVGRWPDAKREAIAELLFGTGVDAGGQPTGIGLSVWRFNIGAGSAEQGAGSGIDRPWRRAEGFLRDDGTYDWSRQAGQRWFLGAARDHGVETVIGFVNSPPVELTRNGQAWGDGGGSANLAADRYDDFAAFLATVAGHFEAEGLGFDYLSPINEPQWDWSRQNGQEGSPYRNREIVDVTRVLDRHLRGAGLGTRIEIPEAARIDFLYSGDTDAPRRDDQLDVLFRQAALDTLPRVAPKVAGHSYFTTWPVPRMIETRRALRDSLYAIAPGLEYWMTEYCILEDNEEIQGPGRDLGMHPALYTARLIHFDLALAGAASWQWWLAVSAGDYKDGLVYVDVESQRVHDSKLLWALGHWSRFLRPGSVRLETTRSDGAAPQEQATGLMVSGYRSADGRPIAVAVNWDSVPRPLTLAVDGIGGRPRAWRPYITDRARDLAPAAPVTAGAAAEVPARSIMTFVGRERGPTPVPGGPEAAAGDPDPVPGNPIVRELFTADPAALVHDGRLYVFSGRDQASPTQADFVMREWHAFSTDTASTDPADWEHHGPLLSLDDFGWADANAWASEVVRGPDGRFYWFVSTRWADAPADGDRMAIGVALADHPLGPYRDAIGGPLVTALMDSASAHNIDPTVLVDSSGVHMYWGSFWEPRHVRLDSSMTALAGGITTPEGLPGFWEAPWIFERDGVYYMLYASNRNLDDDCVTSRFYACIRYATADHPAGPWTHRGIALGQVSSTTNHPAAVEFPEGSDRWWMVYHTADLPGGGTFRRSVAIDRMTFTPDGRIRTVAQTQAPAPEPRPVPTDDASRFAAVECSYTSPWESCDALASGPEPESSDMPGPNIGTRWGTWPEAGPQWIEYRWDHPVRLRAADIYWLQDAPDSVEGGVKRPAEWSLRYWRDGAWVDVPDADGYGTALDRYNHTTFGPVTTPRLRATITPRPGAEGVGAFRWKVLAVEPSGIERVEVSTPVGTPPALPDRVDVRYPDGGVVRAVVRWPDIDPARLDRPGTFTVRGVVTASPVEAEAVVTVQGIGVPEIDASLDRAAEQYAALHASLPDTLFPRTLHPDGSLRTNTSEWWTSGFFPGSLWYLYEHTGDPAMRERAEARTWAVEEEKRNDRDHDIGFKILNTFGHGLRLTGDSAYLPVILTAARTLTTRFDSTVGAIRSWGAHPDTTSPYLVIIDNMMNLELLFFAARATGDDRFFDIGVRHADRTLEHHFRPDGSSYHVLEYDPVTGEVLRKRTAQGHADSSAWARGQAWGLYGYTMTYRETGFDRYLDQAKAIADFMLTHPNMPDDGVPYWDFDAPGIPDTYRDASAGAITAAALLELSGFVGDSLRAVYRTHAAKTLATLSRPPYRTELGEAQNFLLRHGVGHLPENSEVDVPLSYGDYYYLEGLIRLRALLTGQDAPARVVPVGADGWARSSVNAPIFRNHALFTHDETQYTAFYDADGRVTLARRALGDDRWERRRTPYTGTVADAHNAISLAVDGAGRLHLAWDLHDDTLRYARATEPGSLELTGPRPMTGRNEGAVTYPQFRRLPDGDLLFLYRDGASGDGDVMLNRWDVEAGSWTAVRHPLIDGEGDRSAYANPLVVDRAGGWHLSWVWRESWDAATNHDVLYAWSPDEGRTWLRSTGEPYALPITAATAEVAARVPQGRGLINQTGMAVDPEGRPLIATYWRDEDSELPRYRLVWHDGRSWRTSDIVRSGSAFRLEGGGTRRIPISRPAVLAGRNGAVHVLFRDAARGPGIHAATTTDADRHEWTVTELYGASVGQWEPVHDPVAWARAGQLHLFTQRVGQGQAETLEAIPPQPVRVLEWQPEERAGIARRPISLHRSGNGLQLSCSIGAVPEDVRGGGPICSALEAQPCAF